MGGAREEILNRLKNAVHPEPEIPDFDAPVYHSIDKDLDIAFKESLEAVNGSVHLYASEKDAFSELKALLSAYSSDQIFCAEENLQSLLRTHKIASSDNQNNPISMEVGITSCEFLIAHTGSVMVSSALKGGRQMSIFPPIHIVVARRNQLVDYLDSAYKSIQTKYVNTLPSQITLVTGPSRTADIEKTLVMGAHGPRELHVFIY